MGRKAGQLYINPKKFGGMAKPCMTNMVSLLNGLATNQMKVENCAREKELLSTCLDAQQKQLMGKYQLPSAKSRQRKEVKCYSFILLINQLWRYFVWHRKLV
ncbi:hypothetical protein LINPERHAP1_LOCUS31561 [Linum perenne]